MVRLDMQGPYPYNAESVDEHVDPDRIGNFALGSADEKGNLTVGYLGRSDDDLRSEIKRHIGEKQYPHFKFSYASSARDAYLKECRNYHGLFLGRPNQMHPAKPSDGTLACPVCGS